MILFDVSHMEHRVTLKLDAQGVSDVLYSLLNTPEDKKGNETMMLEGALKGTITRWNQEGPSG